MAGVRRFGRQGLDRRRFMAATGAAGAAAFLAACGGGGDEPSGGTTGQATTAAGGAPQAAGTTAPAPTRSVGTLNLVQGVDANTLDPAIVNATPEGNILLQMMDTLLKRGATSLKAEPHLATEFKSVDPLTWEFKIRPNLKFHDGTALDAEAVKFSLERWATEKIGEKSTVPRPRRTVSYDKTDVVDATTVRIKTTAPAAILPDALTSVYIVPPSTYSSGEVATKAVGSGPYKFVEWQKDQRLVMEANPTWWGGTPAFERVIVRPIGETSTRILALKNGEADIIVNVPPDNIADIDKSDKARVSSVDGLRKMFIGMRTDKAPQLADKRVRQAINHAMNWDAISRALLNGGGKRMKTLLNPPHEPPDAKAYEYNVNRAKELLSQAGYPNGFSIDMDAPSGRYIKDKEMAQAIAQDLEKVGIKVNLNVLEWSVYAGQKLTKNGTGPAPLYFVGLGAPVTGQDELFFIHKDYSLDFTAWQNDEYLKLFDQLRAEIDDKKRQEIMNQASKIVFDEAPWLWIYNQVDHYGASKKLDWNARADERILLYEARWK